MKANIKVGASSEPGKSISDPVDVGNGHRTDISNIQYTGSAMSKNNYSTGSLFLNISDMDLAVLLDERVNSTPGKFYFSLYS